LGENKSILLFGGFEEKFFQPKGRGKSGCEGEVNKEMSVCLFVFKDSYVSGSSHAVL
jgi:hypothetical protein